MEYDNGTVGPDSNIVLGVYGDRDGDAQVTIDSPSQLAPTMRHVGFPGPNQIDIYDLTFSTFESTYTTSAGNFGGNGVSGNDESAAGVFLEWACPIREEADRFLNATFGYTFVGETGNLGSSFLGFESATGTRTDYAYRYDYVTDTNSLPGSFPASTGAVIYDPGAHEVADAPTPFDPTITPTMTAGTFILDKWVTTSLDIDLHEIPFGLECGRIFGRTKVAVRGGGTINIVDLDFVSQTNWYEGNRLVTSRYSRSSDTPVRLGAFLGVNLTHPLNEDGSVYLEAHGSYRWVDGITAATSDAIATIDLSSWEAGIGIGILLKD